MATIRLLKAKGKVHFRHSLSAIRHGAAVIAAAALACAGCGPQPWVREGNYVTYDHPFSEASAQAVRKNAEGICRERDQTAFESSRVCSLTQCTTSYQCMSEADARRLAGEKQ